MPLGQANSNADRQQTHFMSTIMSRAPLRAGQKLFAPFRSYFLKGSFQISIVSALFVSNHLVPVLKSNAQMLRYLEAFLYCYTHIACGEDWSGDDVFVSGLFRLCPNGNLDTGPKLQSIEQGRRGSSLCFLLNHSFLFRPHCLYELYTFQTFSKLKSALASCSWIAHISPFLMISQDREWILSRIRLDCGAPVQSFHKAFWQSFLRLEEAWLHFCCRLSLLIFVGKSYWNFIRVDCSSEWFSVTSSALDSTDSLRVV